MVTVEEPVAAVLDSLHAQHGNGDFGPPRVVEDSSEQVGGPLRHLLERIRRSSAAVMIEFLLRGEEHDGAVLGLAGTYRRRR